MSMPIDNPNLTPAGRVFAQIAAGQAAGGGNPIFNAIMRSAGGGGGGGVIGGMGSYAPSPMVLGPVAPGGAAINSMGQAARGLGPNITGQGMWANLPNFGIGYD